MHRALIAATIVNLLYACTSQSTAPESAHGFVSVIGTPLLLAFKVPVCAATVVLAAPGAALAAIAEPSPNTAQPPLRPALDQGVAENCGPPYALQP
ncbi:MAG: hypothetical protein JWL84_3817 [Rhodospirillales bacterium]|jgi:class 3 adenylate cyclase|nr:hypothetical protein [Rhodospirillales bacterium]